MTSTSRPVTFIDETDPLGPPADPTTATPVDATNLNKIQDNIVPWATPENHGAVGDGTDDTAALNAAIATGLNVSLKPGKTYLYRQRLAMSTAGQVLYGNGATIKRQNQAVTTTTTTITSGVTSSIVVASATGLSVGDYITIEKSNNYDTTARQITGISGTTVTISGTFGLSSSGTTNVRTSGYAIRVTADDVKILDLVHDGNSANYSWSRWAVNGGIYLDQVKNPVVSRCHLKNQVGDAVVTNDCTNATIAFNNIDSCTGRGISLGGSTNDIGSKVLYNRLYNCETDANAYLSDGSGSNDGHGSINYSLGGTDSVIHGNQIDTGITGIGALGYTTGSGSKVTGNTIRNMSTYAIDGNARSNTTPANNVTIEGNQFYASQSVGLIASSAATTFPSGWIVRGNIFDETNLIVTCYQDCVVEANKLASTGTTLTLINFTGGGSSAGTSNNIIAANVCNGGAKGISSSSTGNQNATITGNHCKNQLTSGIVATNATPNVRIVNNFVASGAASSTSAYDGISIIGPVEAVMNKVDLSGATNGHGVTVSAGSNAVVNLNRVKIGSNSGATPFVIFGSALNTRFLFNEMDSNSLSDSGTNTIKRGTRMGNQADSGTATLAAGTVTVSTDQIRTGDSVLLTNVGVGGTPGVLSRGTIVSSTSFVINSSSGTDTSTVFWQIVH